jgi:hypothetical protein
VLYYNYRKGKRGGYLSMRKLAILIKVVGVSHLDKDMEI